MKPSSGGVAPDMDAMYSCFVLGAIPSDLGRTWCMQSSVVAAFTWSKSHLLKPSIHESTAWSSGEGFSGMGARSYSRGAMMVGSKGVKLGAYSVHAGVACPKYARKHSSNYLKEHPDQTLIHFRPRPIGLYTLPGYMLRPFFV